MGSRELRIETPAGLGLIGITDRAALVGGRVLIISAPGKGITIALVLPLTLRHEWANRSLAQPSPIRCSVLVLVIPDAHKV